VTAATGTLFEIERARPDSLAAQVRAILPQATRQQVAEIEELLARQIELAARPVKRRQR
jgi:hypothetical protein